MRSGCRSSPFILCQKLKPVSDWSSSLTSQNSFNAGSRPFSSDERRICLFAPPSNNDTHGGKMDTGCPTARYDDPSETSGKAV
ncbi:hypothetical protein AVEN_271397-1 [Araneus ventricosus]|uniref:Uncharacterized protein n=1 Tax=Araneus ventricosus TaxID=182803 RepID=A0A4Y2B037_ARAVE|nr:hypothetical protein AVEN_271397-1 [Araneus ventricosus]